MVSVQLDELEVNAIGAALNERNLHLTRALARHLQEPETPSRDFAIDTLKAAIRDVTRAILAIAEAHEEPEPPADMTFVRMFGEYTEAELRESFGR